MTIRTALAGTVATLLLAPMLQAAPPALPDGSIETTTREMSLPGDALGLLTVRSCPNCAPKVIRLTSQSEFRIGRTVVTFEQFSEFVRSPERRMLAVIYRPREGTVTRLVVEGTAPRAPR